MGLVIVLPAAAAAPPLPPGLNPGGKKNAEGIPFEAILALTGTVGAGDGTPPGVALVAGIKAVLAGRAGEPVQVPEFSVQTDGEEDDGGPAGPNGAALTLAAALTSLVPPSAAGATPPASGADEPTPGAAASPVAATPAPLPPTGRAANEPAPLPAPQPSTPPAPGDPSAVPPAAGVEPAAAADPAAGTATETMDQAAAALHSADLSTADARHTAVDAPPVPGGPAPSVGGDATAGGPPDSLSAPDPAASQPAPASAGREARGNTSTPTDADDTLADQPVPAEPRARPAPGRQDNDDVDRVVRSVGNATAQEDGSRAAGQADHRSMAATVGIVTASGVAGPAHPPAHANGVPVQTAVPAPVAQQTGHAIVESIDHGGGEVHIRLDPPELGDVTIRVVADGDRVQLIVRVERPEVAHLFRQAHSDLASLLAQRGLELTDLFVGNGQSQGQGQDSRGRARGEAAAGFASLLPDDGASHAVARIRHERVRTTYNPDGALVYRV